MTKELICRSPIDGAVYAKRPLLSLEEVTEKIKCARASQPTWHKVDLKTKAEIINKALKILEEQNDEIVTELAWMMGRPIRYGGEFSGVKERTEYMLSIAEDSLKPAVISNDDKFNRFIAREPHGVILVIAPWNYPYLTAINSIVPALMAGNAVILKHATQTLLVGERLVNAFVDAGIPKDIFVNVFLDHETTNELIKERSFDYINLTGSVRAGKEIETAAAGTFVPMGLELGGKDPAYVMEDCNLEMAVETLMDGAMFNSGQCCCGIERIYVSKSLFADFLDKSIEVVNKHVLGNPLEAKTTLGPMANLRFADLIRKQVNDAVKHGATTYIEQMKIDNGEDTYVTPQILTSVNHQMDLMMEENFGPVVGIMKVEDDVEAINLMNDSCYGLTASLWTNDEKRAKSIGEQLETGTVYMNRADYLDPALCWSGCKATGKGGALSYIGYQNLTKPKSYHMKKQ